MTFGREIENRKPRMPKADPDRRIAPYPGVVRPAVADGRRHRLDRPGEVRTRVTEDARYAAHDGSLRSGGPTDLAGER
jgi:hypothetical protein